VLHQSNKSRRLYIGFTDNIVSPEHKEKLFPNSFTAQYVFDMLVYYEKHTRVIQARMREREIKGWRREKNLKLILSQNPTDLSLEHSSRFWFSRRVRFEDGGSTFSVRTLRLRSGFRPRGFMSRKQNRQK
jgi:putative endonuclease